MIESSGAHGATYHTLSHDSLSVCFHCAESIPSRRNAECPRGPTDNRMYNVMIPEVVESL